MHKPQDSLRYVIFTVIVGAAILLIFAVPTESRGSTFLIIALASVATAALATARPLVVAWVRPLWVRIKPWFRSLERRILQTGFGQRGISLVRKVRSHPLTRRILQTVHSLIALLHAHSLTVIRLVRSFVQSIVLDWRWWIFIVGAALVGLAEYALWQQQPLVPFDVAALQKSYRFDLPALQNVVLAVPLLLIVGIFAALIFRPVPPRDEPTIPERRFPSVSRFLLVDGLLLLGAAVLYHRLLAQLRLDDQGAYLVGYWVLVLLVLLWVSFHYDRRAKVPLWPGIDRYDALIVALLLGAGLLIGTFRLDSIPNSVIWDEVPFLARAQGVNLQYERSSFFDIGPFDWPVASSFYPGLVFRLLGTSLWTWRFSSVLIALLTTIPTYLLIKELFGRRLAVLTGIVLISLAYFIRYEREGSLIPQSILPVALAIYLFYQAIQRESVFYAVFSGIVSGLGFYTYSSAWLAPVVCAFFLLAIMIAAGLRFRRNGTRKSLRRLAVLALVGALFGASLATTYGPLSVYVGTRYPERVHGREKSKLFLNVVVARYFAPDAELFRDSPPFQLAGTTMYFQPDVYRMLIGRGLVRTLLGFQMPLWPPAQFFVASPLPGSLGVIFYMIGLVLVVLNWRRKQYLLMGAWFFLGILLLSTITTLDAPSHTHMVSLIPALAFLVALGLDACVRFVCKGFSDGRARSMVTIILLACIVSAGLYDYFVRVPQAFPPDRANIIDFYNMRLEQPRQVFYLTSDPQQYEWVPDLTRTLRFPVQFQSVAVDAMETKLTLQRSERYTFFFREQDADQVIHFLKDKLGDKDIEPEVYRDAEDKTVLMAYIYN